MVMRPPPLRPDMGTFLDIGEGDSPKWSVQESPRPPAPVSPLCPAPARMKEPACAGCALRDPPERLPAVAPGKTPDSRQLRAARTIAAIAARGVHGRRTRPRRDDDRHVGIHLLLVPRPPLLGPVPGLFPDGLGSLAPVASCRGCRQPPELTTPFQP